MNKLKTLEFLFRGTFSLQLLKRLSGNFPSDVKIFVEASFYAAQWTNKNSTVNIQDGPASLSKQSAQDIFLMEPSNWLFGQFNQVFLDERQQHLVPYWKTAHCANGLNLALINHTSIDTKETSPNRSLINLPHLIMLYILEFHPHFLFIIEGVWKTASPHLSTIMSSLFTLY